MHKLVATLFLAIFFTSAFAQKEVDFDDDPSFFDRVYFGGGLGFSSDSYATFISLSPIVGYMITSNLSAGVGVQYQYIKYRNVDINDNTFGGNLFTRYNIQQFFLQGEYSVTNIESNPFNDIVERRSYERLLFGGGISQPLGSRARLNILGMYDILYDGNTFPFRSPWVFRVFISG